MNYVFKCVFLAVFLSPIPLSAKQACEFQSLQPTDRAQLPTVRIAAGGPQATWTRVAQDISEVLNEGCDHRVAVMLGGGSIQNLADLRLMKMVDVALVQEDVLGALAEEQSPYAKDLLKNIRAIAKLHNEELHVVARKDIKNLSELKADDAVSIGVFGSGTAVTSRRIIEKLHISATPRNMTNPEAIAELKKETGGAIAAAFFMGGKPINYLSELSSSQNLHFLDVEADAYPSAEISSSDYPNLLQAGETVKTIKIGTVLAAYNWSQDRKERHDALIWFTEKLLDNMCNLKQGSGKNYHTKWAEANPFAEPRGWPRFEPAAAYVSKEAGRILRQGCNFEQR
jgi:uncharacterized protein